MDWRHGYYADSGYTYGHFAETMPVRLRWAALVQSHEAPAENFRYLDAGCGQGYNLVLAALFHPDSEFVGIDFMPEHIAHGRKLARQLKLSNVTFIEGDFLELAERPEGLGEFDYAVCHGITTWISPEVRTALYRLIGRVLAPGGLFYNGYNTMPGWLPSVSFQHLVLLEQRSKPGPAAITAAQQHIATVIKASGIFDKMFPGLGARIEDLKTRDPTYLVQEYNNHFWQPVFVSRMMDELAAVKLDYLGTASLSEAFKSHIPAELREYMTEVKDPVLMEQLADYAIAQGFRRDLYVKGRQKPWRGRRLQMLRETRLVANPLTSRPENGEPYKIRAGSVELKAPNEVFSGLLDRIAQHPEGCPVGVLMEAENDARKRGTLIENLSMLLHSGWLLPVLPNPPADVAESLQALAAAAVDGAPYTFLPLPLAGCGVTIGETDWIAILHLMSGGAEDQMVEVVARMLARNNRLPLRDGKPVKDQAELHSVVEGIVGEFRQRRLPFLRQTGVL